MEGESPDQQLEHWLTTFDERQQIFEDLRLEIEKELHTVFVTAGDEQEMASSPDLFRVHDLRSRVKKRKSFRDKIERKRYSDPFNQMRDIVGARVVCLFLDDLPTVDGFISEKFEVVSYEDKTENTPPNQFGYRSVHYDCKIKAEYCGPHYDDIKPIVFEIQVRTILQDAWAVIELYLAYKGVNSIPDESRADFSALVGLFHLADRTFQRLRQTSTQQDVVAQMAVAEATDQTPQDVTVSPSAAVIDDLRLNRSTLKAFLRHLFDDRTPSADPDYSELVEELASVDVTGLRRLRELLVAGHADALASEASCPPVDEHEVPARFADVGFARNAWTPPYRNLPNYHAPKNLGR